MTQQRVRKQRMIKIVVKVALHPLRDAELIKQLRAAPNKSAIVRQALRGQPVQAAPVLEDDALVDALEAFVM